MVGTGDAEDLDLESPLLRQGEGMVGNATVHQEFLSKPETLNGRDLNSDGAVTLRDS